jgi:hypothetical protein
MTAPILPGMARERLKDQIEWRPRPSRFTAFFGALLLLLAMGAVYYSIGDGRVMENALRAFSGPPKPAAAATATRLVLTPAPHDTFYWNQEGPYALTEFGPRLETWLRTAADPQVVLVADTTAQMGSATGLLEELRRQGVQRVQLAARPAAVP